MPLEFHALPKHIQEAIIICIKVRKCELSEALILNCSIKHRPTLLNYDWSLKVIEFIETIFSFCENFLVKIFILVRYGHQHNGINA